MKALQTLVVDDDGDFAHSLADLVNACGHNAEVLTSGQAALRKIRDQAFNIAFIDVRMPGVNGLQVAYSVKRIDSNCEIHLMTGFNLEDALSQAVREGSVAVLERPYTTEQFHEVFTSILPDGIAIVVDDDPETGIRIARTLSQKGYGVRIGTRSRETLLGIRGLKCNALVLDLGVPVVDALDFYTVVRGGAWSVATAIIVPQQTASAKGETDVLRSRHSTGLLFKPFDVEPILEARAQRH